ncbi:SRPBCC domain-containing protein [Micromonospora sp. NPDC000089]|uniref:SRPBCC family protein n=1 Tax=unclassified Micromonospora TaxID=2617518 RepID=UPI00368BC1C4
MNPAVVATEHIKAPPEVVFPYFTDPTLIATWLCERAELDPRPGGVFALDMGKVSAHGAYLVVEPPHRLVFSWGIPGDAVLPAGGSTVEVVLTPDGDDTLVVLTHRGLPADRLDSHRAGWGRRLGQLGASVH